MFVFVCVLTTLQAVSGAAEPKAYFQAHRGTTEEAPENTLPALQLAWGVPGAVPEVDVQTTQDGVLICMHDDTPARTTDAPEAWRDKPIGEIPFETLRSWDAGKWFGEQFAGTRVPTLDEVFALMAEQPDRQLYLDIKGVDLGVLSDRIHAAGFEKRVIFVHGEPAMCKTLSELYPGARTMTWLSGSPSRVREQFEAMAQAGFPGISQIQFHLTPRRGGAPDEYPFSWEYLADAVRRTREADVDFQARPFDADARTMRRLLDLGIKWYVADSPTAFARSVEEALSLTPDALSK